MRIVTTSDKYEYTTPVWERSYADRSVADWSLLILIQIQAASDAHIWLAQHAGSKSRSKGYEVVLGASKNTASFIRRGQQGSELASKYHLSGEGPLNSSDNRKMWISFSKTDSKVTIATGLGWEPGKQKLIYAIDTSSRRLDIETVSLSTGFGSTGKWTIVSVKTGDAQNAFNVGRLVDVVTPVDEEERAVTHIRNTPIKDTLVSMRKPSNTPSGLLKRSRSSGPSQPRGPLKPMVLAKPNEETSSLVFRKSIERTMARFGERI